MSKLLKEFIQRSFRLAGIEVRRLSPPGIPDSKLYQPLFSPWLSEAFAAEYSLIAPWTLVSKDRCYVLASLAIQASKLGGEIWECGVYRGGTAMLLAERLFASSTPLRFFDTFEGMPKTDAIRDLHKAGDFSDTSLEAVQSRVRGDFAHFHKGLVPGTFAGLENSRIALAHIDMDIYSAIMTACEFIFPRLCAGGFMVFDDYGFSSCPGARMAVDEFFRNLDSVPLVLPTGQAIVFKSTA